jgi:putative aminopeptidase FrvX
MDIKLLKQLCEIHAPSGNERPLKDFLLQYIFKRNKNWIVKPEIFHGPNFQDCIILKFGKPRTAIFAHMDSIGFTVRYFNQLLPIGSPDAEAGTLLVGKDSLGSIECILEFDQEHHARYKFGRTIDRGTDLTYKVAFKDTGTYIISAYLDNRIGVYNALKVAEKLENGVICFSCGEEHGGGSVPFLMRYLYASWEIHQALVSDITWATDGIKPGEGVVVSLRDRSIPRKKFVEKIIMLARKHNITHQLEVEGGGSSDGRELQASPYPVDWCFVGAPQLYPHSPAEKVHKQDIRNMLALYNCLMSEL